MSNNNNDTSNSINDTSDNDNFTFRGENGRDMYTWCWPAQTKLSGILQIIHGMAEHAGRYADFARFMNSRGYTVYACDLRGHGRTGDMNGDHGYLCKDGFRGITKDQGLLTRLIRQRHPGTPVFLLGHSFGSFIAQEYIKYFGNDVSAVILTGSAKMSGPDITAGRILSSLLALSGVRRRSKLLDMLSFGSYNRKIPVSSGRFSWLSTDEKQVRMYEADRYCGNVMTTGFFLAFFNGLSRLYNASGARNIPKNLPVLLMSGKDDPVGKYGRRVGRLEKWYKTIGMTDISLTLYEGARHEIINEAIHDRVYSDIARWLDIRLQGLRV